MKLQKIDRKCRCINSISIFVMVLCMLAGGFVNVSAQNQSTQNKADQTLKSSARINPVTLAMELSIPIVNYPGRAGNSKPLILNYSSKVWNMKMVNTRSQSLQVSNQNYNHLVYQGTEIRAEFAERSAAGWTSSLQPAIIYSEPLSEVYNEFGYLYTGQVPNGILSLSNIVATNCQWTDPVLVYNSECGGLAWETYSMCNCTNVPNCESPPSPPAECATGGPVFNPGGPGPGNPPNSLPPSYVPQIPHIVKRVRVSTPDGATHEFRESDKAYNCNNEPAECYDYNSFYGTYLSVDGSGLRLVMGQMQFGAIRDVLYFPDGSKYLFTPYTQPGDPPSTVRPMIVDVNGNISTYEQDGTWKDTLNREIQDPFSEPLFTINSPATTQDLKVKGLNYQPVAYSLKWEKLENVFEDPAHTQTKLPGADYCLTPEGSPVNAPHLFENQVPGPSDDQILNGTRYLVFYRTCSMQASGGQSAAFNPTVVSEINLPNGKKYVFKYNEYGEITKITYPSGSYERFQYGYVVPIGFAALEVYQQSNRGVLKRYVSVNGTTEEQEWTYQEQEPTVITIAPDGSRTERDVWQGYSSGFGFEDPRNGMVKEERVKDSNGVLRSRTINEWINTPPRDGGFGERDSKLTRSLSIIFEPGSNAALATLSKTEYDDSGSSDPLFFSHLNVKRGITYHYAVIDNKTTVDNETLDWETTIPAWFPDTKRSSITENDYYYETAYRDRGIIGVPREVRALNPSDPSQILNKTTFFYDNWMDTSGTPPTHWEDPVSTVRGKVTLTRTLLKDPVTQTETNIETSTQYDKFGNLRFIWDAAGNMTETQYGQDYACAYPTKLIAPAPDTTNTHGTNQTSSVEMTYDSNTGLPLSVKDDYGQITKTEYNDLLMRPTWTYAYNFTAPETQTIYDDDTRTVKVRKQIDEQNWDEATTFMDKVGRTIKTQAKDSQGDVIVETHYDALGRVDRVTNPYRANDPNLIVYWNKVRFDEIGRAVESYAPATLENLGNAQSLGMTSFGLSTGPEVGTVVISTDASERKGRSIINTLGQLLRVDEPTAFGGSVTNDLGPIDTPNQPTYYTYSKLGKMVKVQQGKTGEPIQYRYFLYDNLGRLLRVKQPEQEANTGLPAYTDPITGNSDWSAAFTYDALGNVLTATDAKGTVIHNSYDNAGRVKTRSYTGEPTGINTPQVDYYYDGFGVSGAAFAKGKLTKVSSSVSETRYANFDNMGRVLASEQVTDGQTYPMSYKYNLSGALAEETYPSGEVVRNFLESDGDVARIAVSGHNYASDFNYTATGKIASLRLGNGRWESGKLNEREQVTEIALGTSVSDGSLWKVNYDYGELNTDGTVNTSKNIDNIAKQITSFSGLSGPLVQTYKYDSLSRLTEAREPIGTSTNNWIQTFGYDRFGNRNSFNQSGFASITQTPSIDASTNRFSVNQGYIYDKNGNIINDPADGGRSFVFNGDNKQIQVKNSVGALVGTYSYDGDGKRVKKVSNLEATVFVYDANGLLVAEYSNQTSSSPTISYTATDSLGSPRAITDKQGNVISRRDFMPFGEELNAGVGNRTEASKYGFGNDNIRKRFTGYEKDVETGLDFAEARYYNNTNGRFTAVDPLLASGESADPQTFNRYVYVLNNPLALTDPSGLQATTAPNDDGPPIVINSFPAWVKTFFDEIEYYKLEGINRLLRSYTQSAPTFNDIAVKSESNYKRSGSSGFFDLNQVAKSTFNDFGEGNRRLNEDLKSVDPFGVVDLNEKTVKNSLGLASNSDLAASYGNFGFNVGSTFFGGRGAKAVAQDLGAFKNAVTYGFGSWKELKVAVGAGSGLNVHHLIEQRFAKTLGVKAREMLSIVLTEEEHKAFTAAWRQQIGYRNQGGITNTANATREQIENAAREVYKNYPTILRALGLN